MATIDIRTTRRSANPLTIRVPDGQGSDWTHLEAADVSDITLVSGTGEPNDSIRVAGVHRIYLDTDTHQAYYSTGAGSWTAIGVATSGTENAVLYTAQSLTNEQKAQARANIGAGTSDGGGDSGRSDDDVRALVRTTDNIPGSNLQSSTLTGNKLVNNTVGEAKLATAVQGKLHSSAEITTQIRTTTEIPGGHLVNDSVSEDKFENTIVTKLASIPTNDEIDTRIDDRVRDEARINNTDRWPNDKVPEVTLDRFTNATLKQLVLKASGIVDDIQVNDLVFLKGGAGVDQIPIAEPMRFRGGQGGPVFPVTPTDDQIPFGIALDVPTGNRGDTGVFNVLVAGHHRMALLGIPTEAGNSIPQPTWSTNDKIYVGLIRRQGSVSTSRSAFFSSNRRDAGHDRDNVLVGIVSGHQPQQGASAERDCYFDFTGIRAAQDVKDQIPDSSGSDIDPATELPEAPTDGTGAVGTSTKYAREDHRHPEQTVPDVADAALSGNTDRWATSKLSEDVLLKVHQQLSANEKAQVRANIGAGTGGGSNVVIDFVQLHRGNVTLAQPAYKWTEVTLSQAYTNFEWLLIQWGGSHHAGKDQSHSHRWVKVSDIQATTAATVGEEIDWSSATTRADETALLNKYYRILGRYETTPLADTRESREDDTWGSFLAKKLDGSDNLDATKILLASIQVSDPEPLVVLGVSAVGISDDDIPLTGASAVKVKSEASIRRAIPSAATEAPEALGESADVGDSTKFARENHVHPLPDIPSASDAAPQAPGVAAAGDSEDFARANHVHPQQVIPLVATAIPVESDDDTGAVGTSAKYATEDHKHPKQDIYADTKSIITASPSVTVTANDTAKTLTLAAVSSGGGGVTDAVRYGAAQALTDSQKAQARVNIAATEVGPNGELYGFVHNTETEQIDAGTLCVVGGNLPNEDTTGNNRVDTPTGVIPVVIGDVKEDQDSSAMRKLAPPFGIAVENIAAGTTGKVLLKGLYSKALTGSTENWQKDNNIYVRRANDGLTPNTPLASTHYIYSNVLNSRSYQVGVVVGPRAQQDVPAPGTGSDDVRVSAFDFTGREILTSLAIEMAHSGTSAAPDAADEVPYIDTSDSNTLKRATISQLNTGIVNSITGFVRYDASQTLDSSERNQLRQNTGLAATSQIRTDTDIDNRIRPAARAGATTKWAGTEIADNAIQEKHMSAEVERFQHSTFKANTALSENQVVHLVGSDNANDVCTVEWSNVPSDAGPPVGIATAAAAQNAEVKILVAGHRRMALEGSTEDWAKNDDIYIHRSNTLSEYVFSNSAANVTSWRVGWVTGTQAGASTTARDCYFDFRGLDIHGSDGGSSSLNIASLTEENPLATNDTFVFADNTDSDNNKKTTLRKMLAAVTPDQATAEAGTDNQHAMTPLRTKQAIEAVGVGDLDQLRGDLLYSVQWNTTDNYTATVTPTPDNLPSNWRGTSGTARVSFQIGTPGHSDSDALTLATPGRVNNAQGFVIRSWENKSGSREYDKEVFLAWGQKLTNEERTILFSDYETEEIRHGYNVSVHPHEPRLEIKRNGTAVTSGAERGFDLHWWLGGRGPKGDKGDEGDPGPAGGMPAVPANNGLYIAKRESGNQLGWDAIADHPFQIQAVGEKIFSCVGTTSGATVTTHGSVHGSNGWRAGGTFNLHTPAGEPTTDDALLVGEPPTGCMGLVLRAWYGAATSWPGYQTTGSFSQTNPRTVIQQIFLGWGHGELHFNNLGQRQADSTPVTPLGSAQNRVWWDWDDFNTLYLRFYIGGINIRSSSSQRCKMDIHLWQPSIIVSS